MNDTKKRIIEQALIYFSENDYDRASLNSIAKALGVTKGAIYHYFSSKDELFKETTIYMIEKLFHSYSEMFGKTEGLSTKELLKMWFSLGQITEEAESQIGISMSSYIDLLHLMFSAVKKFPEVGEALEKVYSTSITALSRFLKQGQKKGEIRDDLDPEALAFELAAFTEGAMLIGSVGGSINIADLGKRSFENFWKRVEP